MKRENDNTMRAMRSERERENERRMEAREVELNEGMYAMCARSVKSGRTFLGGRMRWGMASLALLAAANLTYAGQASSGASASSNPFGAGTATANAAYNGSGTGWADTKTRSGNVSFGRGVAVGVDQNGLTFSASNAVASRFGPALASTFNLAIGTDGRVSGSYGLGTATGGVARSAEASGFANPSSAGATAAGHTIGGGHATGEVKSYNSRPRIVERPRIIERPRFRR